MTELTQCTGNLRDGSPCAAWAVVGTDPPLCSVHQRLVDAGDGPVPGTDRLEQISAVQAWLALGADDVEELAIDVVIDDLYRRQMWINTLIDRSAGPNGASITELARLLSIHGANATRLGKLLRDRRALSGDAADGITGAIAQALDELSTELGLDL